MLRVLAPCFALSVLFATTANAQNPAPPSDSQISQFLSASPWCSFKYNKISGASSTERVVFRPDGTVLSRSGSESYSSGAAGSVAGQSRGGDQGRWRVRDATLHLSRDGANWEPQQVQLTQNSNGSPILKSNGKEYMRCN